MSDRRAMGDRLSHGTARLSRGLPVALRAILRKGPFVISLTTSGEPEPADCADRPRARGFAAPRWDAVFAARSSAAATRRRTVPGADHAVDVVVLGSGPGGD